MSSERYRPLFKLDAGGMAEVYVAEAESMAGFKKKVAIKRILPNLLKDERFVRMFLDEARLSLHLSHANIVSVFDIGKSSSTYFIVMEYVEGINLKGILQEFSRKRQTFPVPLTIWILNEVLKGLDYAHRLRDPETGRILGIVHRDISPPNILVSWNGEVKLTDFGLAKASTQLESTDPGVVKGKFSYLSPEAASGLEVDARADIFAVGILAYEMLTGRRLFLGESDYQTVQMVRAADVPSINAQNSSVPSELEDIIRKALARDVDERFQTASDFADDLLGFLFSRKLKVSARDLTELIADLRKKHPGTQPKADESNVILKLIEDEFADFRSIDDDDGGHPTGSQPLASLGDYDPSAPLALDGFDGGFDAGDLSPAPTGPGEAEPTPVPAPGSAPMRMDGKEDSAPRKASQGGPSQPSRAPRQGMGMMPFLVLLLVLAAGGGAYYWFVVLGG
ncbi:serine/threonine protein kinase [Paraliomyxa miuraensis]|uniref:serine/threonine protein kinase n=1 Tax=Paraliomyxa miuraensis TaxID=376150 RepID=UPI0022593AD4|nr:serine/threonine-protein kinase [Paraliomyxa miuraensis]MCX4239592.1 serine/threonine protein kinase [Paraliomyxa miuraensis]